MLLICCWSSLTFAGVGESAVITLVFPHGARSTAMGEVGTALADDEHTIFYNPAGLGVDNERWHTGASCFFYEPLLPAFGIRDLWHIQAAAIWQPPEADMGGFGVDFNYINMGINKWFNELGQPVGAGRSYEQVQTVAWGADVFDTKRHYLGASLKYIHSALAPHIGERGEGVAKSVAFDLGYLWIGKHGVRVGATAMNMGPSVFYLRWEDRDPIPFTLRGGVAYVKDIGVDDWTILGVSLGTDFYREFVKNYPDQPPDPFYVALFTSMADDPLIEELSEIQVSWGGELKFFETLSLRAGFLFDYVGERYELTFGLGGRFFGHFDVDWSYIHAPEGMLKGVLREIDPTKTGATGARHGQWRLSFAATDLLDWGLKDLIPFNFEKAPGFVMPPMPPR